MAPTYVDRSDRGIIDAEQRTARQRLLIADMATKGKDTVEATLVLKVCQDALAELRATRSMIGQAEPADLG